MLLTCTKADERILLVRHAYTTNILGAQIKKKTRDQSSNHRIFVILWQLLVAFFKNLFLFYLGFSPKLPPLDTEWHF